MMKVVICLNLLIVMVMGNNHQCYRFNNVFPGRTKTSVVSHPHHMTGPPGLPGQRGPPGIAGVIGKQATMPTHCQQRLQNLIKRIESYEQKMRAAPKARSAAPPAPKVHKTCASTGKSGYQIIDPQPGVIKPFRVYCKVQGGKVFTSFGHDSEKEIRARDCEPARCSIRKVKYNTNMKNIRAVVRLSKHCRQYIKYRCRGSLNNYGRRSYWSWQSFNGRDYYNWGGSNRPKYCACGIKGTCKNRRQKCNCDSNGGRGETSDEGYLTNKNLLPVTNMRFGDLGSRSEKG